MLSSRRLDRLSIIDNDGMSDVDWKNGIADVSFMIFRMVFRRVNRGFVER